MNTYSFAPERSTVPNWAQVHPMTEEQRRENNRLVVASLEEFCRDAAIDLDKWLDELEAQGFLKGFAVHD